MKKILSFILATMLCLSITIPAFALDNVTNADGEIITNESGEATTEDWWEQDSWDFDYSLAEGEGKMAVTKTDSGIEAVLTSVPRASVVGNYTPTYIDISVNSGRKLTSVTVNDIPYTIGFRDCAGTTSLNTNSVTLLLDTDIQYKKIVPTVKATTDGKGSTEFTITVREVNDRGEVVLFSGSADVQVETTTKVTTTRRPVTTIPATTYPAPPSRTPSNGNSSNGYSRPNLSTREESLSDTVTTPEVTTIPEETTAPDVLEGIVTQEPTTNETLTGENPETPETPNEQKGNNKSFIWAILAIIIAIIIIVILILLIKPRHNDESEEQNETSYNYDDNFGNGWTNAPENYNNAYNGAQEVQVEETTDNNQ